MKRIIKYIFTIILISLLWAVITLYGTLNGWWHQPITDSPETDSFVKAVKEEIDKEFVGNFAMAILKNGIVEKEVFYSVGKKVHKNTIFQVSSLSKFVSATGIMKLSELDMIDLDAPVSKYLTRWQLPPSKFNHEQVTAKRLLSHTAGLTDQLGYSGFEHPDSVQTLEASLTKAADADEGLSGEVKVGMEPDSGWKYSGGGFTLLQLLVEETSNQSFDGFMKKYLFEPLMMPQTTYHWEDSLSVQLCEFYNTDGSKAPHFHYSSLAATSLYSSLEDLETFFQLFIKGPNGEPIGRGQISPNALKSMRVPYFDMMGAGIYGLGTMLFVDVEDDEFIIGHDGKSTPPINTSLRINPVTGDGIIVLETGNPDLATRLASDWVFLQTGKVDTLLFTMQLNTMVNRIAIGSLLIGFIFIALGLWRKRRKSTVNKA